MIKASRFFTDKEIAQIKQAVSQAENNTSGEIVPVVASSSGRYDRAEDIVGLVVAIVALCVTWIFFQDISSGGDWALGPAPALGLGAIIGVIIVGFMFGAVMASFFPALRLPFISKTEMTEEVEQKAAEAFHKFRVRSTKDGTGILIYVSLYERMVRIVGDDAISAKLTQKDWDEALGLIINGLRKREGADGLKAAILKCGELLSAYFPIKVGDTNELSNELIIID